MPLNFGGQKRSGAFDTVWPSAKNLKINEHSTLQDSCVSSTRKGHATILYIFPILKNDPRRESNIFYFGARAAIGLGRRGGARVRKPFPQHAETSKSPSTPTHTTYHCPHYNIRPRNTMGRPAARGSWLLAPTESIRKSFPLENLLYLRICGRIQPSPPPPNTL